MISYSYYDLLLYEVIVLIKYLPHVIQGFWNIYMKVWLIERLEINKKL